MEELGENITGKYAWLKDLIQMEVEMAISQVDANQF